MTRAWRLAAAIAAFGSMWLGALPADAATLTIHYDVTAGSFDLPSAQTGPLFGGQAVISVPATVGGEPLDGPALLEQLYFTGTTPAFGSFFIARLNQAAAASWQSDDLTLLSDPSLAIYFLDLTPTYVIAESLRLSLGGDGSLTSALGGTITWVGSEVDRMLSAPEPARGALVAAMAALVAAVGMARYGPAIARPRRR